MSRFETIPVDFATIEPTKEFVDENGQRIVRIIDEKDLKEEMDLKIPRKQKGFVSLEEDNPSFLSEYDYELNFPLKPSDLSKCTNKKVWWTINHYDSELNTIFIISWKSQVDTRQRGRKCPFISRTPKLLKGFNDLTTYSELSFLVDQWDYKENYPYKPEDFTKGMDYNAHWKLVYEDSFTGKTFVFKWRGKIKDRVKETNPLHCPFLARYNPKVLKGFNDLATKRKDLLAEWCWERNTNVSPDSITEHSSAYVYWKCPQGHIYPAYVYSRTDKKYSTNCVFCNKSKFQSYIESILSNNNNLTIDTEVNLYKNYRFDIYLENLNLLIDTDGLQHFKDIEYFRHKHNTFEDRVRRDNVKNSFALEQGIPLLRVPYLNYKQGNYGKKIERWVLDFIDTRQIPEEIIEFYEKKNPLSNYPSIAREMNTWVTEQKATSNELGIAASQ